MSASGDTTTAISTTNFLDTLGVDTHMGYTDGKYVDVSQVISDLKYLGIDQVRDGITNGVDSNGNPNGSAPLTTYIAMAQAGIRFTFIIEATSEAVIQTQLALINQVESAVPGSVLAIEGPNEINSVPITFNGLTGQAAGIAAQQALYQAVQADTVLADVPVDYFTGYAAGGPDPTTTPGLANYDNQHPYPNFGEAPAFWVSRAQALTNLGASDVATAPAVYTETGYSTNQVYADVQEVYTLDLLMDTASQGISQTYLYDLLDAYAPGSTQGDDGFGLFDYTTAPKPVATAIHNLTSLLQDSGATAASFTPTNLAYSISGLPSTGNSMLMEKSNGAYVLVVWAEPEIFDVNTIEESTPPTESVTVTLPRSFGSVQVFDPTIGTSAIASYTNADSVTFAVTDHPILVELGAAPSAATIAPALTPDTLTLNVSEDYYDGDAQFTVAVDGVQVGGVLTTTASHTGGASQNITLLGDFGPGAHTVAIDFLNDLYGGSAAADRNLYVNSITLDGLTTTENTAQNSSGTVDYTIQSGTSPTPTQVAPQVTLVSSPSASDNSAATLGTAVPGNIGDPLTVELLSDADFSSGSSLTLTNGDLIYTPGLITASNAGVDTVTYSVTDTTNGLVTDETQAVNLIGPSTTPVTIPSSGSDTLVLNMSGLPSAANGVNPEFTISVDGVQIGGVQTVTALQSSAQGQDFTLYGNFDNGPQTVVIDYVNGFTGGASDLGRTLFINSLTLNGQTTFANTPPLLYGGATSYTLEQATTPVSNAGTTDTLVLNMSETAAGGQNAQFMVSVDGELVGDVETVTASESAGQSQNITLTGDFGSGSHTVAIDLLNGFSGNPATIGLTLDVNSITLDGETTSENTSQTYLGSQNYTVESGSATPAPVAPVVKLASSPSASDTSPATLGTAVPGDSGDTLTVKLLSDADFSSGSSLTLTNGALVYTPGVVTASNAGTDQLTYAVTDTTNGLVTDETQNVTLVPPPVAPKLRIVKSPSASDTSPAILGTAVPGDSGDTLTVKLLSDNKFSGVSSITLTNGELIYTPGVITASNAGIDRISYLVTDITNGLTTQGIQNVTLIAPPVAPVVTLASSPSASDTSPATLGTAVPGDSGDTLTVKLLSDADFSSGSSLTLTNGALVYTPGVVTASNAGTDQLTYAVTDTTNGLVTDETQNVTLIPPPVAPKLKLIKSPSASDTSPATLGTAVPGDSGDTLVVKLLSDNKFGAGSSITLTNGELIYTPGVITTSNAGIDRISYVVTDTTNGLSTQGIQNVTLTASTAPAATPVVTLASSPSASASSTATLGAAVPGTSGDTLTVHLLSDADFSSGSSLTLTNGNLIYTPGVITTSNAGPDQLTYVVTDTTNGSATDETQNVTLVAASTAPPVTPDIVTATVSTGTGLTTKQVDLSTSTSGTFVATSTSGVGANPLILFNWDPATQLSSFTTAVAAGDASIVAEGDSTTLGFDTAIAGFRDLSYSSELSQALSQAGVSAQFNNFFGLGNENGSTVDNRITFTGTTTSAFPFDAGGQVVQTNKPGDGFTFTLNWAGNYNRLTISYLDTGTGSDNVSVVSSTGNVILLGTIRFTGTGQTLTKTFSMTPGSYQQMMLQQIGSTATDIQGVSFSSTTTPSIQVEDAGIGGETAVDANMSMVFDTAYTDSTQGAGPTAGVVALAPSLAIVDFGINDIDYSSFDGESLSSIVASYEQVVMTLKNSGSDVIIMLPEAWSSPTVPGTSETYYQQDFPTLLAQIENFAVTENVGVINLSATYGNAYQALVSAGLLAPDGIHPDATLDADIGAQLAGLLTNAIENASSGGYVTVRSSANNATIAGTATVNTLIGTGANDTYVMNATDQSDTIINGSSATTAATNVLDVNAANHEQLWFEQSGKNLVIDVLGTNQEAIVQNWFNASSAQLQTIVGNDGYTLTAANVQNLVQAMATFSAANAAFNPASTMNTSLTNPAYGATLTTAVANAWHHG